MILLVGKVYEVIDETQWFIGSLTVARTHAANSNGSCWHANKRQIPPPPRLQAPTLPQRFLFPILEAPTLSEAHVVEMTFSGAEVPLSRPRFHHPPFTVGVPHHRERKCRIRGVNYARFSSTLVASTYLEHEEKGVNILLNLTHCISRHLFIFFSLKKEKKKGEKKGYAKLASEKE